MSKRTIEIVDRGRGPQLSTSRVTVQDLVPYFQEGCSAEEIMRWIPTLTAGEITVVLEYYRAHQRELDEEDRLIRAQGTARKNPAWVEKVLQEGRTERLAITERLRRQHGNGEPQMKKTLIYAVLIMAYCGVSYLWGRGGENFDRLADADRKTFEKRFVKEIWPLLSRNGKDGCVGCHNGKQVTALTFSGDASKDYHMLLKEGFFLLGDRGSLHGRVIDKNETRRMPLKRPAWNDEDIQVLAQFVADLDKKQKK